MQKNELNTLFICAFRYALGRKTYVVSEIIDLIDKYMDALEPFTIVLMKREINKAIETNNYGMEMDKEDWLELLEKLNDR